jgi:uncharacterized membrane protein YeaQ/YmgE (transglycosylase-associated protein family)
VTWWSVASTKANVPDRWLWLVYGQSVTTNAGAGRFNSMRLASNLSRHWAPCDGWLAEQFMKTKMGLVANILIGVVGATAASFLFGPFGVSRIGCLITGFIGAAFDLIVRAIRRG